MIFSAYIKKETPHLLTPLIKTSLWSLFFAREGCRIYTYFSSSPNFSFTNALNSASITPGDIPVSL